MAFMTGADGASGLRVNHTNRGESENRNQAEEETCKQRDDQRKDQCREIDANVVDSRKTCGSKGDEKMQSYPRQR